jgi:hypothetical protein
MNEVKILPKTGPNLPIVSKMHKAHARILVGYKSTIIEVAIAPQQPDVRNKTNKIRVVYKLLLNGVHIADTPQIISQAASNCLCPIIATINPLIRYTTAKKQPM